MNKIANVENVIGSAETMTRHPELYHYTKPTAFEGIIGSQTLWCSHYREMLDNDEVRLMRNLLPLAVAPRMDAIVEAQPTETPALGRFWTRRKDGTRLGERIVRRHFRWLGDILHARRLSIFVFDSFRRHCV
jgi:hypothetical protein